MVCKKLIAFHNLNEFPMVSIFIRFGLQMVLKINGFTEIKRFWQGGSRLGKGGING
jgi:hypothetical protein